MGVKTKKRIRIESTTSLYPLVDPQQWADRYGFKIETRRCPRCAKNVLINIPYAHGTIRGLEGLECEAPCKNQMSVFTTVDKELSAAIIQGLRSIF